eukprot:SAG31_NODE_41116_length_277_cov_1.168539_1_plen_37_part_01
MTKFRQASAPEVPYHVFIQYLSVEGPAMDMHIQRRYY